jgi:SpoVK/Ycf46/Vps4 family AAA+-type ATPase
MFLKRCKSKITEEEVKSISMAASGFVGADIASAVRDAYIRAMRRVEVGEQPEVWKEDLEQAVLDAKPSSIKDIVAEVPKVKWEDIGGNEKVKQQLKE